MLIDRACLICAKYIVIINMIGQCFFLLNSISFPICTIFKSENSELLNPVADLKSKFSIHVYMKQFLERALANSE